MSKKLYPAKERISQFGEDINTSNERGRESLKKQVPALAIVAGAVIIAAAVIIIAVMNR